VSPEQYAEQVKLTKFKARIEIVGDFEDLKKIAVLLKEMAAIKPDRS
jgi:hypothetical protein